MKHRFRPNFNHRGHMPARMASPLPIGHVVPNDTSRHSRSGKAPLGVSNHLSLGIYFRDPDGNGVEVSYELPRDQWPRQEQVFASDVVNLGKFPGPWDDDPAYRRAQQTVTA